jgi:hypothetical protein
MAHPEASTTMVDQALKLQAAYDDALPRLEVEDPRRFAEQWRRLLTDVQELL